MSVAIRCERIYDKESLKAIIQSCGCCPPEEPCCPPLDCPPCGTPIKKSSGRCCSKPTQSLRTNMTCPPQPTYCQSKKNNGNCYSNNLSPFPSSTTNVTSPPQPACPLCSFICPPCTGFAYKTCTPVPKSVPASNHSIGSILRTPMISGGIFYIGTSRLYPPKPVCLPKPCSHSDSC